MCHGSTVVATPDALVVAWFEGSHEGADDTRIGLARVAWDGTVEPIAPWAGEHRVPVRKVRFARRQDGTLVLMYHVGRRIADWSTHIRTSVDGGRSWSSPAPLAGGDGINRGPVRVKPLVLRDGTWLAPASREDGPWRCFVDISHDEGRTWQLSEECRVVEPPPTGAVTDPGVAGSLSEQSLSGKGVIQPCLWEAVDGRTVQMRTRSSFGRIYRSASSDGGRTWATPVPTDLPNPNSGIDALALGGGRVWLVGNSSDKNWGPRSPLAMWESLDDGETWSPLTTLEDGPGEFSYPALVASDHGPVVTYTWDRKAIRVRTVPPA